MPYRPRRNVASKPKRRIVRRRQIVRSKPRLAKQVYSMVNKAMASKVEKKEYNVFQAANDMAQIWVNSSGVINSGHYFAEITPTPSNGNSDIGRIGDEIQVSGVTFRFQAIQQANRVNRLRGRVMLVAPKFMSNQSQTVTSILNPNPFVNGYAGVNIYDSMCTRNQDYLQDWIVLKTKTFAIAADTAQTQKQMTTFGMGVKFKKPWTVRFDSSNAVSRGRICILIVLDSGNSSTYAPSGTGTGTTTGIPVYDTLSGCTMSWFAKWYFMDP